jgi:hypothetical protein
MTVESPVFRPHPFGVAFPEPMSMLKPVLLLMFEVSTTLPLHFQNGNEG